VVSWVILLVDVAGSGSTIVVAAAGIVVVAGGGDVVVAGVVLVLATDVFSDVVVLVFGKFSLKIVEKLSPSVVVVAALPVIVVIVVVAVSDVAVVKDNPVVETEVCIFIGSVLAAKKLSPISEIVDIELVEVFIVFDIDNFRNWAQFLGC
jgi:hypothetical protein